MKYIIVKDREDKEFAIVFPEALIHKDVARIHRVDGVRLISAGFCSITQPFNVWGYSETLDMHARPEDRAIIVKDFDSIGVK